MTKRPQVYRVGKVERLEFHRQRMEKANKRDRGVLALEQEQAIHEVLVELAHEQGLLVTEIRSMHKDIKALIDRLNGGDG